MPRRTSAISHASEWQQSMCARLGIDMSKSWAEQAEEQSYTPIEQPATATTKRATGNVVSTLKGSKCDLCDCYSCTSRLRGGITFCICRFDSTFDLSRTKFSDGTKSYILKMRAYHQAHPDVSTLKGVKFEHEMPPYCG